MRVREIYGASWLRLFGAKAMVLYPFIFFRDHDVELETYIHEWTHVFQIRRDGFFSFYLTYLKEYFLNYAEYRNHFEAYWNVPYEVAARYQAEVLRKLPGA